MKAPANFLYLGGDKCGSTWIHHILDKHPQVSLALAKELFFFDRFYAKGMDWYSNQFPPPGTTRRQGEICHDYLYSATALARIATDLPTDSVFLICLRDPVARSISHYRYLLKIGHVKGDFPTAIVTHPQIISHSLYSEHVTRARNLLGKERVKVLWFDQLQSDPAGFGSAICEALGIDYLPHLPYSDRILDSAGARSPLLVRNLRSTGWLVRRLGFPSLVSRVKDSRAMHKLLFKKASSAPALSDLAGERSVVDMLSDFREDFKKIRDLLGPDVPDWPSKWPT